MRGARPPAEQTSPAESAAPSWPLLPRRLLQAYGVVPSRIPEIALQDGIIQAAAGTSPVEAADVIRLYGTGLTLHNLGRKQLSQTSTAGTRAVLSEVARAVKAAGQQSALIKDVGLSGSLHSVTILTNLCKLIGIISDGYHGSISHARERTAEKIVRLTAAFEEHWRGHQLTGSGAR